MTISSLTIHYLPPQVLIALVTTAQVVAQIMTIMSPTLVTRDRIFAALLVILLILHLEIKISMDIA